VHPFEADSSKKSLGLQLMCIGQFPIAPAAPPVHHRPRLRALALLGRRPHQRVEGHVIPASEKPTQQQTHAVQQTVPLFDHLIGAGEEGFGDGEPERLGGF
jgi:hypothetical protein